MLPRQTTKKSGFTLVELSIVLVIISLIAGGVLVGVDLIDAARVRGTITQVNKYKAAYQTFRLKYNCIAGDCKNASQFGLTGIHGWSGSIADGDGDGLIYSYLDGTTLASGQGKSVETWAALTHLGDADLIEQRIINDMDRATSNISIKPGFAYFTSLRPTTPPVGYTMPPKAGNYIFLSRYPSNGIDFNTGGFIFSPEQALAIDSKVDDGLPMSGSVRASWYNYSCAGLASGWTQGPCFNAARTNSNGSDANMTAAAPVDDTVTPPIYKLNAVVATGYEIYGFTSLHMPVD